MRLCLCLFYRSQCGLLILYCGEAVNLVFRSFSEGSDSYVARDFLCPWDEVVQDLSMPPSGEVLFTLLMPHGE